MTLKGVEFDGCGQYDTTYAGLRIQNVGNINDNSLKPNIIQGSSFHNCNGICMWITQSKNIFLDGNVIFKGKKYLVYA